MLLYVDTASITDIEEWAPHPWVSGFTTNPSLMKSGARGYESAMDWAKAAVYAAGGKAISIDGPMQEIRSLGMNVWRKTAHFANSDFSAYYKQNYTAICSVSQVRRLGQLSPHDIISVFAGRIMDTGRDPQPVIDAAKATGAQVLWASCREPYNIVQAERAGCDIITVPPAILTKYLEWRDKPLELVADETIAQFARDAEGLQWT